MRFQPRSSCAGRWLGGIAVLALLLPAVAGAAQPPAEPAAPASTEAYRLGVRDQIEITIFDEPDLTVAQRIDSSGQINLTLVGTVVIAGKTVREAEDYVAKLYIEKRILRRPMATVRVVEYAPREVSVNGYVGNPGMVAFPKEKNSLDIVEVISRAGGLTERANGKDVQVTRLGPDGRTITFSVNVEEMITRGRGQRVAVYPGDVVSVPPRVF
jgi:polysaccharide biosynthesis/export protein